MTEPTMATQTTEPVKTPVDPAEEEWFDLLPVEMLLIKGSLVLGIFLLVVFVLIFRVMPGL